MRTPSTLSQNTWQRYAYILQLIIKLLTLLLADVPIAYSLVTCVRLCICVYYPLQGSLVDYLRTRGRAVISKQNQLDFAKHVCKGMVYLESKNFVHR